MVSSVQNSSGSTAYLKSSQLGNSTPAGSFKKQVETPSLQPETAQPVREPEKAERSSESGENRDRDTSTQLEARNDNQTLRTEQTRGSLLDIAV